MNIIFTGGGTGGHLYPAISAARVLKEKYPDSKILFVGSRDGVEASLIPKEGFDIKFVTCSAFYKNPMKLAVGAAKILRGVASSLSVISSFKPDVVVGSGGYVSAPVTFAAFIKKIPVVLLEQNTLSGKTNRLIGKIAKKICISFEGSASEFPKGKTVFTGNPVRTDIVSAQRSESRKKLNIGEDRTCILITGASQGAKSINEAILDCAARWKDKKWTLLHLTGSKNFDEVKSAAEDFFKQQHALDYRIIPFMDDISSAYAACDLVIARAGATTIAEITARGIPAVFVPYPYAAEDHQKKNALFLEKEGAGIVIEDSYLKDKLASSVENLISDTSLTASMAEKSRRLGKPDAVFEILKVLESFKSKDRS